MKAEKDKQAYAQLLLNTLWGLISIALLLLVFYFIVQKERLQTQQYLFSAADKVSDNFDKLVDHLIQTVYGLSQEDFNTCSPRLMTELQAVMFNNPEISGILIKDSTGKFICGTFPDPKTNIISNQSVYLSGPIQTNFTHKPAFILQQRIGHHFLQIFLLKEVLEKKLHTETAIMRWVALKNNLENKILLQIEPSSDGWKERGAALKQNFEKHPSLLTMDLNLDNYKLMFLANQKALRKFTWFHEIVAIGIVLFLSLLAYLFLRRVLQKHFSLHKALENAIKNGSFFPVYQPIINIQSEKFCGAEILLRWRTGNQEIIMPELFISDAEQSGLIVPITLQLIEKTFAECKELLLSTPDFHLAFNLSAVHFVDKAFFDSFFKLCEQHQIPAEQIMLEITERDLLRQDDLTLAMHMKELRLAGFSLAIDDFGTGHASISYLQHFPFNYLKIDQLFIRAIGTGAITETLNQSIIQMAKNLKLNIIAEGVETFIQQEFLQEQGVYLMQGWYFAQAMPFEHLVQLVKGVHYEKHE